jgi:DNA-binding MarR family transcriptional regulator
VEAVAPPDRRRPQPFLPPAHDPKALSWILRRAVRRYRTPVAAALQRRGFSDLPQQGVWAVCALARSTPGLSGRDLVTRMDISKQAVSQLVDTLVTAGYVVRRPSPEDRRRTLLSLTARGRRALRVIDETVAEVEVGLAAKIGDDGLRRLYLALEELDGLEEPVPARPASPTALDR